MEAEAAAEGSLASTLPQKVVAGGMWTFGLRIAQQVFMAVRILILLAVFTRDEMGVVVVAFLVVESFNTISKTGVEEALIQREGDIEPYLNAGFTISIVRGAILAGTMAIAAVVFAVCARDSELASMLIVLAVAQFIQGAMNTSTVYFRRELDFKSVTIMEFAPFMADFSVTIGLALLTNNVWALVAGSFSYSVVMVAMGYYMRPFRPRIDFDLPRMKELLTFGKWVLASVAITFLLTQGDDLYVAAVISAAAVALYQMSYSLSNIPATAITQVISAVTMPAYSRLQADLDAIKRGYLRVLSIISWVVFPITVAIIFLGPLAVNTFLQEGGWNDMAAIVPLLAVFGLLRAINTSTEPVFMGMGKPRITSIIVAIQLAIMVSIMIPMVHFADDMISGIQGVCWAVLIAAVAAFVMILSQLQKAVGISVKEVLSRMSGSLFGAVVASIGMYSVRELSPYGPISTLVIAGLAGAGTYLFATHVCFEAGYMQHGEPVKGAIREVLRKVRSGKNAG